MFREEVAEHYRSKGYAVRENVKVRGQSGAVHHCDLVAQSSLGNLIVAFEDAGGFEGPEMNAVRRMAQDIGATPVVAAKAIPPGVQRFAAQWGVVLLDERRLHAVEEPEPEPDDGPAYPPWPGQDEPEDEDEPTPWPRTARSRPQADGPMRTGDVDDLVAQWSASQPPRRPKSTDPGFWNYPREGESRPTRGQAFAWLQETDDRQDVEEAPEVPVQSSAQRPRARSEAPRNDAPPQRAPASAATRTPAGAPDSASTNVPTSATTGLRLWHWFALAITFGATAGGVFYALAALFG